MNLASIDLETTGVNPEEGDRIVEIGIVYGDDSKEITMDINDPNKKYFHAYVYPGPIVRGSLFALNMNTKQIAVLVRYETDRRSSYIDSNGKLITILTYDELAQKLHDFFKIECRSGSSITILGKNFGTFDLRFLKMVPGFNDLVRYKQRIADVGSQYARTTDRELPNLEECMRRSGLYDPNAKVPHTAKEDALITFNVWSHESQRKSKLEMRVNELENTIADGELSHPK